jgi:hypothetical protein
MKIFNTVKTSIPRHTDRSALLRQSPRRETKDMISFHRQSKLQPKLGLLKRLTQLGAGLGAAALFTGCDGASTSSTTSYMLPPAASVDAQGQCYWRGYKQHNIVCSTNLPYPNPQTPDELYADKQAIANNFGHC